jgi:hypothetical protein
MTTNQASGVVLLQPCAKVAIMDFTRVGLVVAELRQCDEGETQKLGLPPAWAPVFRAVTDS